MKRNVLSLIVAVAVMIPSLAQAKSHIKFTDKSHDFGAIREEGGVVSYEFEFVNDGDEPLVLLDAKAECGCTRPEIPLQPIAPGKKAKVRVSYNPDGRPGEFVKSVKVTTNDPKNKKLKLKISGNVIPRSR